MTYGLQKKHRQQTNENYGGEGLPEISGLGYFLKPTVRLSVTRKDSGKDHCQLRCNTSWFFTIVSDSAWAAVIFSQSPFRENGNRQHIPNNPSYSTSQQSVFAKIRITFSDDTACEEVALPLTPPPTHPTCGRSTESANCCKVLNRNKFSH